MSAIEKVRNYLNRNGITYRKQDERLLIFSGNSRDGIYVDREDFTEKLRNYLNRKNNGITWEWRGNYSSVYIKPKAEA